MTELTHTEIAHVAGGLSLLPPRWEPPIIICPPPTFPEIDLRAGL